jgi:biotin carboxyl carrier protein
MCRLVINQLQHQQILALGNENVSEKPNVKSGTEITSPIIGTAYHAPEPGAKKFVEVGKKIKKGDTIMIVEGDENNESCAINC